MLILHANFLHTNIEPKVFIKELVKLFVALCERVRILAHFYFSQSLLPSLFLSLSSFFTLVTPKFMISR